MIYFLILLYSYKMSLDHYYCCLSSFWDRVLLLSRLISCSRRVPSSGVEETQARCRCEPAHWLQTTSRHRATCQLLNTQAKKKVPGDGGIYTPAHWEETNGRETKTWQHLLPGLLIQASYLSSLPSSFSTGHTQRRSAVRQLGSFSAASGKQLSELDTIIYFIFKSEGLLSSALK